MNTLQDLPSLTTSTTVATSPSPGPSLTSIDSSSDDTPQLSFEYIWGDDGNFLRISKRSPEDIHAEPDHLRTQTDDNDATAGSISPSIANTNLNGETHAHLHEILGNELTAENAQSIASVLSSSATVISQQPSNFSRPFHRAVSGSAITSSSHRPSILGMSNAADRPLARARRVPIEEKRKEDAQPVVKVQEDDEREREMKLSRTREKENWGLGIADASKKDKDVNLVLSSSLTRTHSDPYPSALVQSGKHVDQQSQPLLHDQVAYRPRRPLSKQQRVLSGIHRPMEVLGGSRTLSKDAARPSDGSSGSSTPEDIRPSRPASRLTGGARRITKEERERQEREAMREATELQAQLERQRREERAREEDRARVLEQEREMKRLLEAKEEGMNQEAEAQARRDMEQSEFQPRPPSRQRDLDGREHERYERAIPIVTHQRRESETVMPEALSVPTRLSPPARQATHREERAMGTSQSYEPPPGLSIPHPVPQRTQHRRSPTAPEASTRVNGNGLQPNEGVKGKTWSLGAEVVGDVDRDLGGLGPQGENGVRERGAQSQVQVNGAKNFTVNGKMFGKLDMIGKGGSSRVYRVITPSNEIFALKRVSLDRTDQETMQGYMNEIALLRRLDGNSRIIRLIESEVRGGSKGHLMLVMECGEIDLARLIAAKQSSPLDMVWVANIWKQMLEAVHVIHEEKIVHSDLKPANFVLVKGELKLIDFGIANAIANDTTNIQRDHQIGTVNYMSPESIEVVEGNARLKVGRPSDVWSLGCILYQMIYGSPPFHQMSILQKMRAIPDRNNVIEYAEQAIPIVPQPRNSPGSNTSSGSAPPKKLYHLAKPVPLEVIETLKSCLKKNPKERETIPQLLDAGWLHPDRKSENLVLSNEEVIINLDLLSQVITWAMRVGETTGTPKIPEELQETILQTFTQLKSCSRRN